MSGSPAARPSPAPTASPAARHPPQRPGPGPVRVVAEALTAATGRAVELVHMTTDGDTSREALSVIGGTGVFVTALREALSPATSTSRCTR